MNVCIVPFSLERVKMRALAVVALFLTAHVVAAAAAAAPPKVIIVGAGFSGTSC